MSKTEDLLGIANASGFPLQLRVEHEINSVPSWEVIATEHHWEHEASGQDGYIDIVARTDHNVWVRVVVECKKATGLPWIFFVPEPAEDSVKRAHLLCTCEEPKAPDTPFWAEMCVNPESHESHYSTVRGQHKNHRATLENTAELLLRSTEGLAVEESSVVLKRAYYYTPIVVTAADLKLCTFSTECVSLETGEFPAEDVCFKDIPWIRFCKGLASGHRMPSMRQVTVSSQESSAPQDLSEANIDKERTVFVVQAKALSDFLGAFSIKAVTDYGRKYWPHLLWNQQRGA
jgi:hypothetical protein